MSVEVLKLISVIAYVISGLFLLITIGVFIKFNVREILGEITGITERRAINDIRSHSIEEKRAFFNPSYMQGRTTGRMLRGNSKRLSRPPEGGLGASETLERTSRRTAKLAQKSLKLHETTVLVNDETGKTAILKTDPAENVIHKPEKIAVVTDIIICDTNEIIE